MERQPATDVARHIDIAMGALARGLIDMRTLAEVMIAIGAGGFAESTEGVWLAPGRLQRKQLDSILLNLANPVGAQLFPNTLLFGVQPVPPETLTPPVSSISDTVNTIEHRYRIQRTLGGGGMGDVYECVDTRLKRRVALKAMRAEMLVGKQQQQSALDREASLTAHLEHPNIIPIYDAGDDPALGPYYVMRLVDRPSLESLFQRLSVNPGLEVEYSLSRLLRLFIQVCHAVDYAHTQGIVHCDLKPANILLGPFGEVLIVDWGLARRVGDATPVAGGTPGYMSPQQMVGVEIDLRTDVFALGSILYEILTLQPAFTMEQLLSSPISMVVVSPTERAPKRNVPQELETICMKALESVPAGRFQSVREMSGALELYLEGTRERDRREAHADELTANGDGLAHAYQEFLDSRPAQVAELEALRNQIPPYAGEEQKRPLWEAEERLAVVDNLALRTLQAAIGSYDQALDEIRDHAAARRGLAQLYSAELQRAIARRDEFDRVYFEGLVRQYDDGTFATLWDQEGAVTVDGAHEATVGIARYELVGRRLVPETAQLPTAPFRSIPLRSGSHLVTIGIGSMSLRVPVLVKPGAEAVISIDGRALENIEPGMVYIPQGPALLRDDEGQHLREVPVAAFLIADRPVTFAAYLEFVLDVFKKDAELGEELLPRSSEGEAYWRWDGESLVPAAMGLLGGAEGDKLLGWPVVGVDVQSASNYTLWLSKRTNRRYRLPTEDEWEKAARGVDGRRYPWGDQFDASFCLMRQSRPGVPRLEASGAFATDVSPYGVHDVAGGVADWVRSAPRAITVVARGGAWCDWPADCRLGVRRLYWASERSSRVGFRLARSL